MMLWYTSLRFSLPSAMKFAIRQYPTVPCRDWADGVTPDKAVVTRLQKEPHLMSNFIIRVAKPEDRSAVADLCCRALLPADTTDNAGLDRLLWHTSGIVGYVAESADIVVGVIFGSTTQEADATISGSICTSDCRRARLEWQEGPTGRIGLAGQVGRMCTPSLRN